MANIFTLISPDTILHGGGAVGIILVAAVIFAETGLLIGLFFPGDTLLFLAGLLASHGKLSISILLPTVIIASILGYETGYEIGRRYGSKIFKRKDGLFFRHEYIDRTKSFFVQHGGKTILLARFIPYVRTVVSSVAGVAKMDRRLFAVYNLIGGIFWAGGLTLVGYWLGNRVPKNFDAYIIFAAVIGLFLFHSGTFWHVWRDEHRRASFKKALAEEFNHFFRRGKN